MTASVGIRALLTRNPAGRHPARGTRTHACEGGASVVTRAPGDGVRANCTGDPARGRLPMLGFAGQISAPPVRCCHRNENWLGIASRRRACRAGDPVGGCAQGVVGWQGPCLRSLRAKVGTMPTGRRHCAGACRASVCPVVWQPPAHWLTPHRRCSSQRLVGRHDAAHAPDWRGAQFQLIGRAWRAIRACRVSARILGDLRRLETHLR